MSLFTQEKPKLFAETQDYVDESEAKGAPPVNMLSPETVRENFVQSQTSTVVPMPEVDMKDIELEAGPTGTVPVRIVRPKGSTGNLPAVLYLHGGGWVTGGRETHDRLIREIAHEGGVAVVFPDYGLAPEHPYPVALEQCYAVFEEMCRSADEFGINTDGFILMGDSAGGNLATVIAMLAHERGGPRALAQILFYPVVDTQMNTDSYSAFSDGPLLTKKAMAWYFDNYIPDKNRREERNVSPLYARDEDLEALPPTLIITAENDPLRDEGEDYARRLDELGVDVACFRLIGAVHDFAVLNSLANTASTRIAITLAVETMKKTFQATFPMGNVITDKTAQSSAQSLDKPLRQP
ncbi:MAG: alpha/beta hydrolase [Planctomycetaceae bacterium]|nr:alpha/beta hydrolase [Planctomycetaceae bacterium]